MGASSGEGGRSTRKHVKFRDDFRGLERETMPRVARVLQGRPPAARRVRREYVPREIATDFLRGLVAVRGVLVVWVAWVAVSNANIDFKFRYGEYGKNA